jgi:ribosomal-protein-alanine N-acetyltransferase
MAGETTASPRFVVSINGRQQCVAGFEGYAVLAAHLTHVQRVGTMPEDSRWLTDAGVILSVGGLQGDRHFDWLHDKVFVGDEVTFRLREGGPVDPATSRTTDRTACRTFDRERSQRDAERHREQFDRAGGVFAHRLEVAVNGTRLCTAGVETGVVGLTMDWVRRRPSDISPADRDSAGADDENRTHLHVGGLENDIHLSWGRWQLDVGDEIAVRILGPGPVDVPAGTHRHRSIPHENMSIMLGSRISLREFVDDDLDFLAEMLGDAEVMRYWPRPLDRVGAEQWLRRQQQRYLDDGCGYWLVVDSVSHEPVGQAGVLMTQVEGERLPALGYMIHRPYWRRQYGHDAAWGCVMWCRWSRQEPMIYTLVRPENRPSMALALKLGMRPLRNVVHEGFEHVLLGMERQPK